MSGLDGTSYVTLDMVEGDTMLTRISSRCIICMLTVLLVAGVCSAKQPAARAPQTPVKPAVAPEAITALKKMGAFLRTLQAFTIHADTSTDEVLADTGQKIQFGSVVDYSFRSPDRLRVDVISDRKQRQFFYDGHTLTLYGPREQYYASVPAPPTIRKTLEFVAQRYDLEVPLADLFFWGTDEARLQDIKAAIDVGPSWIDGVLCDHYAFRQADVDWQLWIERSDTPVPRKLVITTTTEKAQPQYVAKLTWNLTPQLGDTLFTFTPPADAHKIVLRDVNATPEGKPRRGK
jgi:hypothetical protein